MKCQCPRQRSSDPGALTSSLTGDQSRRKGLVDHPRIICTAAMQEVWGVVVENRLYTIQNTPTPAYMVRSSVEYSWQGASRRMWVSRVILWVRVKMSVG